MNGWIGVDLDGTLAEYHGWVDEYHIGEPIKPMVDRVRAWLRSGQEVRIFTARANADGRVGLTRDEVVKVIQDWCEDHVGHRLPVTNVKDYGMIELWDDRAIRVVANQGQPCCDHADKA